MAQKDPLVEYRNEGHVMFQELNRAIREEVVALLFHAQVEADRDGVERRRPAAGGQSGNGGAALSYEHETIAGAAGDRGAPAARAERRAGNGSGNGAGRRPSGRSSSRSRERRPERPLLVRLGQEVQALPRAPEPARRRLR